MENVVAVLLELSYETDCQPISREELVKKYNERYSTNLPLDTFWENKGLAIKILTSNHSPQRKAMLFFLAQVPLSSWSLKGKLKEVGQFQLDQNNLLTRFSLFDDGKILFQTRKEYIRSVERFCSKFFESTTTPMTRRSIYEAFMDSGDGYGSLELFLSTYTQFFDNIFESNGSMEQKAEFCFVTGYGVPDECLAKWRETAVVEVDYKNRIVKFQSQLWSFEKESRRQKRRMESDEGMEPMTKRVMETAVPFYPSEPPPVYQPFNPMMVPQGSIFTWPAFPLSTYSLPLYESLIPPPPPPPFLKTNTEDSTVGRMTPPFTPPLASEQPTEEDPVMNTEAREPQILQAVAMKVSENMDLEEPDSQEPETSVAAPSTPEVAEKPKKTSVVIMASANGKQEPKNPDAQKPVLQKKNPVNIKQEILEDALAEPRAPEVFRPTEEEPAETEMEVSVETTKEPVAKKKPVIVKKETPEVASAEQESRPKVNVKPEPEVPEEDAPDVSLAKPAHCESPLTPPITPPLDPAPVTEQPSEDISGPQTLQARDVEMEVLVEITIERVSKAPEVQEPISIKQEAPEDDAPVEPQASRPKINIKSEPMNAEDDAPDAPTPSPVYTVLNEFYMMLSDVLIKFGSANFKETDEKWKELLREVKKNDGPVLTSQEIIIQFAACLERRLVGSSLGSSAGIHATTFMLALSNVMGMGNVHFEDEEANKLWRDLKKVFVKRANRVEKHEVFKIADIDSCFMRIAGLLLFIL